MGQQVSSKVLNNFSKGLKTEFTGFNFPEDAWTEAQNVVPDIIGNAYKRGGFNFETNAALNVLNNRTDGAVSSFKWDNAGGDGNTQIIVQQSGSILYFYLATNSTTSNPLSTTLLPGSININTYTTGPDNTSYECQYAVGNGYLFVFCQYADPIYCIYSASTGVTANRLTVQIRDFIRLNVAQVSSDSQRLIGSLINTEFLYNLSNQGWGKYFFFTSSTSVTISTNTFTVTTDQTTLHTPIRPGDKLRIYNGANYGSMDPNLGGLVGMVGFVTVVTPTTIQFNSTFEGGTGTFTSWNIAAEPAYQQIFSNAAGAFPSYADTWWSFKDTTDVFNPVATLNNVTNSSGPAPIGHYILNAFSMDRGSASGFLTDIAVQSTNARPTAGCWFSGRLWMTGVKDSFSAAGDLSYYTWTENIYFSQTIDSSDSQSGNLQFGRCYQVNDPTDENLFDILPSDGGVITIPGTGVIYKLFPIQNGLLVFAANGIWFITGSQGIGFSATDYTITKISNIKSISSTSFVNVLGYPMFWNEEGIYIVAPSQQGGGLTFTNICLGTILTYYNNIPLQSKLWARGDYDPVNYTVNWCFNSHLVGDITQLLSYDSILNFNTSTQAFYPYTFSTDPITINGVIYVTGPGSVASEPSGFKFLVSNLQQNYYTFAEENDFITYTDFTSALEYATEDNSLIYTDEDSNYLVTEGGGGYAYPAYFISGYQIRGQGQRRWQPDYIYIYSDGAANTGYVLNGRFDYGRWTAPQVITNNVQTSGGNPVSVIYRRHKIRGQGLVFQIKVAAIDGSPFNILGWSVKESQNMAP